MFIGAGAFALFLAFTLGLVAIWRDTSPVQFSPEGWKISTDRLVRGRMVRSLLTERLLEGKSREEVVGLLGAPDGSLENVMFYRVDVGQRVFFRPWTYNLEISFRNGAVDGVKLAD